MRLIHLQKNERQLEDDSSEFSENENSEKTDESQPVDSGGEMRLIHLQKNERQLEDDSSEFSENEDDPSIKLDRLGAAPSVTLSPSLSTDE
jgi:hypothetical protein